MSIATEIERLQTIKSDIRVALSALGVDASTHNMEDFAPDIVRAAPPVQLVQNGNFETGTTGWITINSGTTISYDEDEKALVLTVDTASSSTSRGVNSGTKVHNGSVYYMRTNIETSYSTSVGVKIRTSSSAIRTLHTAVDTPLIDNRVFTYTGTNNQNVYIYSHYGAASSVGQYMTLREFMLIDLTSTFGAGNEPDVDTCVRLFADDYYEYYIKS